MHFKKDCLANGVHLYSNFTAVSIDQCNLHYIAIGSRSAMAGYGSMIAGWGSAILIARILVMEALLLLRTVRIAPTTASLLVSLNLLHTSICKISRECNKADRSANMGLITLVIMGLMNSPESGIIHFASIKV